MALTETFLELAPEFGGTRFGPFSGMEIRLGSDPSSNDITLPENLGVLPQHVKLINQGDGSFIVAPIQRSAGVFMFRSGAAAKQVTSPIALQSGSDTYSADSFSVVTAEGPRFYVLQVMTKPEAKTRESQLKAASKRLSGKSLWAELKRQGLVMFLTTKGGQEIQRWLTFIKTGAILRPRNIITAAGVLLSLSFAGGGLGLSWWFSSQAKEAKEQCGGDVAGIDGPQGPAYSVAKSTAAILVGKEGNPRKLEKALRDDSAFRQKFVQALKSLYASDTRLNRLRATYKSTGTDFSVTRDAMKAAGWPDELVNVMAYTAVSETMGTKDWLSMPSDSAGAPACGRGPMQVTWRQSLQMGARTATLDAAIPAAQVGDESAQKTALLKHATTLIGLTPPSESDLMKPAQYGPDPLGYICVANEEQVNPGQPSSDPRAKNNLADFISTISPKVGPNAAKMPSMAKGNATFARLMKYYAYDSGRPIDAVDMASVSPATASFSPDFTKEGDWATGKAAQAFARAVLIPCMATLDEDLEPGMAKERLGVEPDKVECALLEAMVKYDINL